MATDKSVINRAKVETTDSKVKKTSIVIGGSYSRNLAIALAAIKRKLKIVDKENKNV